MVTSKTLSRAEEALIANISRAETSLKVSKQLKFDKKTMLWQEKELEELKKSLKEIGRAREKTINHEIRVKMNKQRKEWFKMHPTKTLIDYHNAVTIPRLKKLDKKLKKRK